MAGQYRMQDFVDEARDVVGRGASPEEALSTLAPGFERLLVDPAFVRERLDEIGTVEDETCLYRDPDSDFVILARGVGSLGERGTVRSGVPHDHGPLWALYGVYAGQVHLQRYEVDLEERAGRFPGLRLTSDVAGEAGTFDAIPPYHLHLPITVPGSGAIVVVVYNRPLASVVRRAYLPDLGNLIEFQGSRPPTRAATGRES